MSEPNIDFVKWATGFSGCNGGDIGSPESRSIWVCGFESGGESNANKYEALFQEDKSQPSKGWDENDASANGVKEPWEVNLKQRFFIAISKLLSVIDGKPLNEYKSFAKNVKPFVKGSSGYFSLNLFPINFNNMKPENWKEAHSKVTGFPTKIEYIKWIEEYRFPIMKSWLERYQPRLIICVGKLQKNRFLNAFTSETECDPPHRTSANEVYSKRIADTIIVIIPFMNGKPDTYINEVGDLIKNLINEFHQQ